MQPCPSGTDISKGHRLQVFQEVRLARTVEEEGKADFGVGHGDVGAVAHVVLESPQRGDARLVGVGNVRVHRRVGIARDGQAVVRAAQHVEQLLLANGPVSGHAQREDAGPDQGNVPAGVEADGAKRPSLFRGGQPVGIRRGRAHAIDKILGPHTGTESMVDVEPWASGVVVHPGDLKAELLTGVVVGGQGEQIRPLNDIPVEAGGQSPSQAANLVKSPTPLPTQQMRGRFHELAGAGIEARA